jgi:hypothetical protein
MDWRKTPRISRQALLFQITTCWKSRFNDQQFSFWFSESRFRLFARKLSKRVGIFSSFYVSTLQIMYEYNSLNILWSQQFLLLIIILTPHSTLHNSWSWYISHWNLNNLSNKFDLNVISNKVFYSKKMGNIWLLPLFSLTLGLGDFPSNSVVTTVLIYYIFNNQDP